MNELKSDRPRRGVKSFVRREGRITPAQERALANLWERYGVPGGDGPLSLPELFGREAPCHLEIGSGNGDFLLEIAQRHPENNYLGVEVHRPGLGSLLRRAAALQLANLRVLNMDAVEALATRIPDAGCECIYLFFPDPWPKKRHHKRRLFQSSVAAALRRKLKSHGRLFIATDWEDYAAHIVEVMSGQKGFVDLAAPATWAPRPCWRPVTRYERRALRLGHLVRDLVYGRLA